MTYSFTQISQYLSCPRRYRYRYLDGWQEKDTRAAMLFGRCFEKAAADIINPDVCNVGGLLELKEIGAMAEAYTVVVAPHGNNSTTVGLAASLQAAAVMPNFLIMEYPVAWESTANVIARNPLRVEQGAIALPTTPGLGLELDEAALERFPLRDGGRRRLRTPAEERP